MFDVAEKAGVDKGTVSRVLHGEAHISEKTRARVMDAVRSLDYHIDRNARNLSTRKSSLIGLVLRDFSAPWLMNFLSGLDRALSNSEYELILKSTGGDARRAARELVRLGDRGVEGIVWCDGANPPLNAPAHVIALGFAMEGVCSIVSEGEFAPVFETGVLVGRLMLNLIAGKKVPSRRIIIDSGEGRAE